MRLTIDLRLPIKQLLVVLVLLIVADGLISQFLIAGGFGVEGNPILRTVASGPSFLPLKLAGALLVTLVLWDIHRRLPKVGVAASALCVLLYTGIVYWNLAVLLLGTAAAA